MTGTHDMQPQVRQLMRRMPHWQVRWPASCIVPMIKGSWPTSRTSMMRRNCAGRDTKGNVHKLKSSLNGTIEQGGATGITAAPPACTDNQQGGQGYARSNPIHYASAEASAMHGTRISHRIHDPPSPSI